MLRREDKDKVKKAQLPELIWYQISKKSDLSIQNHLGNKNKRETEKYKEWQKNQRNQTKKGNEISLPKSPQKQRISKDIPMESLQKRILALLSIEKSKNSSAGVNISGTGHSSVNIQTNRNNQPQKNFSITYSSVKKERKYHDSYDDDNLIFEGNGNKKPSRVRNNFDDRSVNYSHKIPNNDRQNNDHRFSRMFRQRASVALDHRQNTVSRSIRQADSQYKSDDMLIDQLKKGKNDEDKWFQKNPPNEDPFPAQMRPEQYDTASKRQILFQAEETHLSARESRKTISAIIFSDQSNDCKIQRGSSSETLKKVGKTAKLTGSQQSDNRKDIELDPAHSQITKQNRQMAKEDQREDEEKVLLPMEPELTEPKVSNQGFPSQNVAEQQLDYQDTWNQRTVPVPRPHIYPPKVPTHFQRDSVTEFLEENTDLIQSLKQSAILRQKSNSKSKNSLIDSAGSMIQVMENVCEEPLTIEAELCYDQVMVAAGLVCDDERFECLIEVFYQKKYTTVFDTPNRQINFEIKSEFEIEQTQSPKLENQELLESPQNLNLTAAACIEEDSECISPFQGRHKLARTSVRSNVCELDYLAKLSPTRNSSPEDDQNSLRGVSSMSPSPIKKAASRQANSKMKPITVSKKPGIRGFNRLKAAVTTEKLASIRQVVPIKASSEYSKFGLQAKQSISANIEQIRIPLAKCVVKPYGNVAGFAVNSINGLVKSFNEDRITVLMNAQDKFERLKVKKLRQCNYFGLYKGHGGQECSEFAKEKLHNILLSKIDGFNPGPIIKETFASIDSELLAETRKSHQSDSSGCSVLGVITSGIDQ